MQTRLVTELVVSLVVARQKKRPASLRGLVFDEVEGGVGLDVFRLFGEDLRRKRSADNGFDGVKLYRAKKAPGCNPVD